MESQYGEWIADVERPADNPGVKDGTSNTLMISEVIQFLDEPVHHGDLSVVKLLDAANPNVDPSAVQTGTWVLTNSNAYTSPTVAMETITIVHEGFELM